MAKEEKQIKINIDPALYAITGINMGFNEEVFDIVIVSGNQARQFRCSPKHAKRINLLLTENLDSYEKKFGKIKTKLLKIKDGKKEEMIGFASERLDKHS